MTGQDRLKKAETFAAKTQAKMDEIDRKRIAESKAIEPQRKAEQEIKKQEYGKAARETKMQKRKVNVEIASGIIDLLLDMGNEAFDVMKSRDNRKMTKEEWRQFMEVFKQGKKVSLRNVVAKVKETGQMRTD
jgi:hypothetical protein